MGFIERYHATVQHDHAMGKRRHTLQVVRGHDDGAARLAGLAKQRIEHVAGLLVEAGMRLIKKQHIRVVNQRARNRQALLHPA